MSAPSTPSTQHHGRRPLYPHGWGSGKIKYVSVFKCFSLDCIGRTSLEIGDKIILPAEALESINRLKLPFPLLFEIKKYENSKVSSNNKICKNEVINEYKKRIENIYRSTNPSKLNKIDKLLKKYSNNPHELYIKICSKYGIIPKSKVINKKESNNNNNKKKLSLSKQFCSVYEFSSPSDSAYLPHWM
eukprot:128303_1